MKKKYIFPCNQPEIATTVKELATKCGLTVHEAAILYNRGAKTVKDVTTVLRSDPKDLLDPRLLMDASKAATIINRHIAAGNFIEVYSDYDADGFGGAVVGKGMLVRLGARCDVYTNHREMGFGMCVKGIQDIIDAHPDVKLIITADNGIVAYEAIDYAVSKGIEVIVTDHHQPDISGKLPNASAVVNANRKDDTYPCKYICGAATIWKVLSICYFEQGIPFEEAYKFIDVVSLSTVADVVPLVGENRIIVTHGLRLISADARPQWKIFKKVFSNFEPIKDVNSRTIAFTFAPAINAASRMEGTIEKAIRAFDTDDVIEMESIIKELFSINEKRKLVTKDSVNAALIEAQEFFDLSAIVIESDEFFEGVVGLIAGQLREKAYLPTIVLTDGGKDTWRGSGRSIPGFHIKDALDAIQAKHGILLSYGGHSQACGLSIKKESLVPLRLALLELAGELPAETFIKKQVVDYVFVEDEINDAFIDAIKNLEPYGNAFDEPFFGIRKFAPREIKYIGDNGQHLVLKGETFDVVSWYGAEKIVDKNNPPEYFTCCGRFERDSFGIKLSCAPEDIII